MTRLTIIALLLAFVGCAGTPIYKRCNRCGIPFKQQWYQTGLPGQSTRCPRCGEDLMYCHSAEDAGWDESRGPDFVY